MKKETATRLKQLSALVLSSAENEDEELLGILAALAAQKKQSLPRGPYNAVRSDDFLYKLLHTSTERRFKAFLRMDRDSFGKLHTIIQDDPIFVSTGPKPQRPPWYQLAVFLLRHGHDPALKTAEEASIAEGTVYLYCKRVTHALREIRPKYLSWPDTERRAALKAETAEYGFPGCIGIVDGSLIPLATKPRVNGELYWCRKKFYSVILQAICDNNARFTEFEMGWPGSVQDTTVFRESDVWLNKSKYFEDDEYILADKGYPLTKFTIRPFASNDLTNDPDEAHRRRNFNFTLSSLRIKIEHSFGMLKGRFPALRSMFGSNLDTIFCSIEALMVIHNILLDLGDDPEEIEGYNGNDDAGLFDGQERGPAAVRRARQIDGMDDTNLYRTGLYRRKALLDLNCP